VIENLIGGAVTVAFLLGCAWLIYEAVRRRRR
jgi:hypothetical protein